MAISAPKEIVLDWLEPVDDTIHGARRSVLMVDDSYCYGRLHLLRPVPARRQAAPRQSRRGRRRKREVLDRRPHCGRGRRCGSCCAASGLLPRGSGWQVRGRGCLRSPGAQRAPRCWRPRPGRQATAEPPSSARLFRFRLPDSSRSRPRRVGCIRPHLPDGANPRFVVTSLAREKIDARGLYGGLRAPAAR